MLGLGGSRVTGFYIQADRLQRVNLFDSVFVALFCISDRAERLPLRSSTRKKRQIMHSTGFFS